MRQRCGFPETIDHAKFVAGRSTSVAGMVPITEPFAPNKGSG